MDFDVYFYCASCSPRTREGVLGPTVCVCNGVPCLHTQRLTLTLPGWLRKLSGDSGRPPSAAELDAWI